MRYPLFLILFLSLQVWANDPAQPPAPAKNPEKIAELKKDGKKHPTKIVVLGDSLTEGYGILQEKSFPSLIEKRLKTQGKNVVVVNGGISGSTSASAYGRMKWHLQDKPDIVILALGSNDGLRGQDPNVTKKNLVNTIKLAQENKVLVILAGMQMPPNYGKKYRAKYAKMFADVAKETKVAFIPFLLEGVGGISAMNQKDGLHPNEKGHEIMADIVMKELVKHL